VSLLLVQTAAPSDSGAFSSNGIGTLAWTGKSVAAATGSAIGIGLLNAVGSAIAQSAFQSQSSSLFTASGKSNASGAFISTGSGIVAAEGNAFVSGGTADGDFNSSGIGIFEAEGSVLAQSDFNISGTSDVVFAGSSIGGAVRYDGWKPRRRIDIQDEQDLIEIMAAVMPYIAKQNDLYRHRSH
jgi:hypothetical protein